MPTPEIRINVYASLREAQNNGEVISRVRYNSDLDYWDGHNHVNGGRGMHKGITKLRDGRYVIIIGSQWEGSRDYAYVVSPEEALQEIIKSGHEELLNTKKLKGLKPLLSQMVEEEDDVEE